VLRIENAHEKCAVESDQQIGDYRIYQCHVISSKAIPENLRRRAGESGRFGVSVLRHPAHHQADHVLATKKTYFENPGGIGSVLGNCSSTKGRFVSTRMLFVSSPLTVSAGSDRLFADSSVRSQQ
jgi:hypothetical protein